MNLPPRDPLKWTRLRSDANGLPHRSVGGVPALRSRMYGLRKIPRSMYLACSGIGATRPEAGPDLELTLFSERCPWIMQIVDR